MEKEIKLKLKGTYGGHSIKTSGVVHVDFSFNYTELIQVVPLIQCLNNNIRIVAKVDDEVLKLGSYMLNQVKVNHDGTSSVRFNSIIDSIEADNLNKLYGKEKEIQMQIKSKIILEVEE